MVLQVTEMAKRQNEKKTKKKEMTEQRKDDVKVKTSRKRITKQNTDKKQDYKCFMQKNTKKILLQHLLKYNENETLIMNMSHFPCIINIIIFILITIEDQSFKYSNWTGAAPSG